MVMMTAKKIEEFSDYNEYYEYLCSSSIMQKKERIEERKLKDKIIKKLSMTFSTVFLAFLICVCLGVVVYNYANICELKYHNYELKKETVKLEVELEDLKSNLEKVVVLENIEKIAKEELGMQYPKPEQIVYITSKWNYKLSEKDKEILKSKDNLIKADDEFKKRLRNVAVLINNYMNKRER